MKRISCLTLWKKIYDSNDNNYFLDPTGGISLKVKGNIQLGDGGGFGSATAETVIRADASIKDTWQFMRTAAIPVSGDVSGKMFLNTHGTDPSENDILYFDDLSARVINGSAGHFLNGLSPDANTGYQGHTL